MKARTTACVHVEQLSEDDVSVNIQRNPDTIAVSLKYDLTIFLSKEQAQTLLNALPVKLATAIAFY